MAKHFADFRPSIYRENGRKKFHEKSSTFSTVHQIKFFHCCNSNDQAKWAKIAKFCHQCVFEGAWQFSDKFWTVFRHFVMTPFFWAVRRFARYNASMGPCSIALMLVANLQPAAIASSCEREGASRRKVAERCCCCEAGFAQKLQGKAIQSVSVKELVVCRIRHEKRAQTQTFESGYFPVGWESST